MRLVAFLAAVGVATAACPQVIHNWSATRHANSAAIDSTRRAESSTLSVPRHNALQPLLDPTCCTLTAPAAFNVTFNTTIGPFTLHVERAWAPLGVDRFFNLVSYHFFDSSAVASNDDGFFRVLPGFGSSQRQLGNPST